MQYRSLGLNEQLVIGGVRVTVREIREDAVLLEIEYPEGRADTPLDGDEWDRLERETWDALTGEREGERLVLVALDSTD